MENYQLATVNDRNGDLSQRWYVEYKYRHPETKKFEKLRVWISSKLLTKNARYTKANEIKAKINTKLRSGFNPYESVERNYTLEQAFNEVLLIKKATISKRAKTTYASKVNLFLNWCKDNKCHTLRPNEFSKQKAQAFLDYILIEKKCSPRTFNNYKALMHNFFESFLQRDYVDNNVWKKIPRLKPKETALSFFSDDERMQIAIYLKDKHYPLYCVALLIYYCYLRPAEIVRLRVGDIDFKQNQIIIKGSQSKNGKTQPVVMHQDLCDALALLELDKYNTNDYLFSNNNKLTTGTKELDATRISEAWKELIKEGLGIKKNIYDMKATGVAKAIESGIDTRQIQKQIRHSSLEQTQIYLDKTSNRPGQVFREKMPKF